MVVVLVINLLRHIRGSSEKPGPGGNRIGVINHQIGIKAQRRRLPPAL